MKPEHVPAALLLVAALAPLPSAAQTAKEERKPAKARAVPKADAKPSGAAAAMQAWQELARPGPAQEKLAAMAGSWSAHVREYPAPGAPAQESDGTSEMTMILGGRYLEQTFHGEATGQTFDGKGWTGWDGVRKRYVSAWIDSMGIGIMETSGTFDPAGKTLSAFGSVADPVAGRPVKVRTTTTLTDADHVHWEMWSPGPKGKPFKSLEIDYTRRK